MYRYTCALLALLSASLSPLVRAAPTAVSHLRPRQTGNSSSPGNLPTAIWIPLVVVAILFMAGLVVACGNRRVRGWSWSWGTGAAQAAGASTGTTTVSTSGNGARELTADQLVGTNGNANANANGGTNRARRPRRTRRTPSQISTHSLPAYMKEPGEQEIVIVRGPEDMEDMPIPITVTMPAVDEHDNDTPEGSIDLGRPGSVYVPIPNTSNDVPLLDSHEHDPHQHLDAPPNGLSTRRSFDSMMSSEENSQVHYMDDAPPYEAVVLDSTPDLASTLPQAAPAAPTAPTPATDVQREGRPSTEQEQSRPSTSEPRRRSLFMSIFNPRNSRIAPSPVPTNAGSPEPRTSGHTREGSGPSVISVTPSERDLRPRSRNRIRHQPSHSGSGSMFSLISRTRSNGNLAGGADRLTSPSLISLNSISAPLPHTLVRTEFTYPKSGPTPEQLRLISSRESFARFGVPYGPDAIAFAASASRVELEPPPGFEEVAGEGEAAGPSMSASSSEAPATTQTESSSSAPAPPEAESANTSTSTSGDESASDSTPESQAQSRADSTGEAEAVRESVTNATEVADSAQPQSSSSAVEASSSSIPSPSSPSPSEPTHPHSPTTLPSPSASPSAATPTSATAPPSAFKAAFNTGSLPARAASRASSYMTFATAEESIPASEPPTPGASQLDLPVGDEAYESAAETPVNGSAPTTPRLATRHLHESTDTTITPHIER
ncbi:hypothetical protein C8Q73DRAFT_662207 [Cubamyces lactineus]|nr:hypothetical protein C8Q73DRAFT_662207 [Cubamyces lactineus]